MVWDAGAASQIPISYERTERRQEDLNLIPKTQETLRKIAARAEHFPSTTSKRLVGKKTTKCIWPTLVCLAWLRSNLTIVTVH